MVALLKAPVASMRTGYEALAHLERTGYSLLLKLTDVPLLL